MVKQIELTQGKFAIVDDEDYDRLNCFLWYAEEASGTFYAVRQGLNRERIAMHQVICLCEPGYKPNHKNWNGLDNRKENLEPMTQSQNVKHQQFTRSNSGERYISLRKNGGKKPWYVSSGEGYIGRAKSLEQAIVLRDRYLAEHSNV